ncbi:hypothetical protein, partial [Xanthomonas sp. WCS2017Cala2-12]|uniref:hypothetical protein n=1 Tax=Xanthomonas sp. WCS2017Cala2-12 TaxID=3073639 RepID=UPI00288B5C8B
YIQYNNYNGHYYTQSPIKNLEYNFSNIENEVNSDYNYDERVEFIESKHNNGIDTLKKEVEKLKSNKYEIENWSLKQIFNEIDINEYLNDFSN